MAIWDRAWPKAPPAASPTATAEATAPKSKKQIEVMRLPLDKLGKLKELSYPASDSSDRMYDAEGLEMRACTVKIDRKGRGKIKYEDGETGTVRIEWIADA